MADVAKDENAVVEEKKKFVIDVSGIAPELLKQELSGTLTVKGRTLQDSADANERTWKREGYVAHLTLEGATVGDLITFAFSTSAWVRYQSRARKQTAKEIDKFLATPLSLGELTTQAERQAVDPTTAGLRAFDKMTPEEQLAFIQELQKKANAAKAEQAGAGAKRK